MNILTRLRSVENLPTLPEVFFRLQKAVSCSGGNIAQVTSIVEGDPALAAAVLKTANAAFYCSGNAVRVSSVKQAVSRIGFSEVLKISSVLGIVQQFSNTNLLIGYRSFWRHSLSAAGLFQHLAEKVRMSDNGSGVNPDELFAAGLFHDIGILVYDQFFHEEFAKIVDFALSNSVPYLVAEAVVASRETHSMLGSGLLELWRLSPTVVACIRDHHDPFKASGNQRRSVAIAAIGEYLLTRNGTCPCEGDCSVLRSEIWDEAGISMTEEESLRALAACEVEKTDAILSFSAPVFFESSSETRHLLQFI